MVQFEKINDRENFTTSAGISLFDVPHVFCGRYDDSHDVFFFPSLNAHLILTNAKDIFLFDSAYVLYGTSREMSPVDVIELLFEMLPVEYSDYDANESFYG